MCNFIKISLYFLLGTSYAHEV